MPDSAFTGGGEDGSSEEVSKIKKRKAGRIAKVNAALQMI